MLAMPSVLVLSNFYDHQKYSLFVMIAFLKIIVMYRYLYRIYNIIRPMCCPVHAENKQDFVTEISKIAKQCLRTSNVGFLTILILQRSFFVIWLYMYRISI